MTPEEKNSLIFAFSLLLLGLLVGYIVGSKVGYNDGLIYCNSQLDIILDTWN